MFGDGEGHMPECPTKKIPSTGKLVREKTRLEFFLKKKLWAIYFIYIKRSIWAIKKLLSVQSTCIIVIKSLTVF